MIANSTVEAVRDANVVEVVGRFVTLKQKGANYSGCCPFHNEKTPSFTVNPVRGSYKCFGCGKGGDALQFVMDHKGVDFPEAVEIIADICNITKEYEQNYTPEMKEKASEKEILYKVTEWAAGKFQENLKSHTEGLEYWTGRGFSQETIDGWRLGFAPDGGRFLANLLKESGKTHLAVKVDLIKQKEDRNYDTYSNRVIIPITDKQGRVIGFGGRTISSEGKWSKYINPSETPLYSKSHVLFGLSQAAKTIREKGEAILTEGYTDVIRLHEAGYTNAVATCGTALTADQAKLLSKYCKRVLIMRDSDKAGLAAAEKDVKILMEADMKAFVVLLPENEDPDSFFKDDRGNWITENKLDGVTWYCEILAKKITDIHSRTEVIENLISFFGLVKNPLTRSEYFKQIAKDFGKTPKELEKLYALQESTKIKQAKDLESEQNGLPSCFSANNFLTHGFDQLEEDGNSGYPLGIYFKSDTGSISKVTNFTIKPLYHIVDQNNGRRLVELWNGRQRSTVELNDRAVTSMDAFDMAIVNKGPFYTDGNIQKLHFKRIAAWVMNNVQRAYEMNTLGWQPEGFFAFADKVIHRNSIVEYNEMGAVEINNISYMSMGMSSVQSDFRQEDNPYENDLYLKFKQSPIDFSTWAKLFYEVYPHNGAYGIVFVFITLFKDIIRNTSNKVPHLFCYGTKGSGKSDFAESITWLFYSGKDADGNLRRGFNLNPGQSTPFSFFNLLSRFRNCPVLLNEFNEQTIEDYKFGALKAAFDGEGREVGDGSTGKKRKTKIDKVQGTCIVVGQYLSGKDDGSLLSRSIPAQFVESFVQNITEVQKLKHKQLKDYEELGLSSIISEILEHRDSVQKRLAATIQEEYRKLYEETRRADITAEPRTLKNFGLSLAMVKIFEGVFQLPFTYKEFYDRAYKDVVRQTVMIKDTSILTDFWKTIEFLFDKDQIKYGEYYNIKTVSSIVVVEEREDVVKDLRGVKQVIYVRFSSLYQEYAIEHRRQTGNRAMDEQTLIAYLKDQPYFIGLVKIHEFKDKRNSAYALRADMLGVQLQKDFGPQGVDSHGVEKDENNGLPF